MSGGFVARDIARALRRADELQEADRRRREQDVANKFAELQLQNATRRSQWDVEDRPIEVAARARRTAREIADDTYTQSQRNRTTTVLQPREDEQFTTNQLENRATTHNNALTQAQRDWRNAEQIVAQSGALAARYGAPYTEEEAQAIRAAAARGRDAAFQRDMTTAENGIREAVKSGNTNSIAMDFERVANQFAREYPGTDTTQIIERLKGVAADNSMASNVARAVDEATLRAEAQRISRGRQIAALEAQYNDPATTGIQRQWIEQQLRSDFDAQMQTEEVPVARMSGGTAPIVIDRLTMPADNTQEQAPFTGSAPTMPSVFNRGASTNGIADRFRMMSNRENQEPSPDLPTIVVPETRSSDRIAGPFREGTPVTQRRMFAVPNRSAVTSDNGVKTFTLENGERRYIIGNYMFDEAGNPTPLDNETGATARAPQLRWDPRSRAYWQWDATSNKWVPAEFGTPPGTGGSVRRTGGNSAGAATPGANIPPIIVQWQQEIDVNREAVSQIETEIARLQKEREAELAGVRRRNPRMPNPATRRSREIDGEIEKLNKDLISAQAKQRAAERSYSTAAQRLRYNGPPPSTSQENVTATPAPPAPVQPSNSLLQSPVDQLFRR